MNMSSENMTRLAAFVTEHYGDEPDRLALQKEKWPGIDVAAAVSTLVSRRKLARKAPVWAATEGLVLPRTLSAEQCSGEAAARHKARAIKEFLEGCGSDTSGNEVSARNMGASARQWRIADLTGGLGVDCFEFSKVAGAVLYNEMLPELAATAEHNFRVLGAGNIEVSCFEASPQTLGEVAEGGSEMTEREEDALTSDHRDGCLRKRLEKFRPDAIFLDPARRDDCGKKVFLLEDCSPDILKIKDMLLEIAPVLVLKLSPMADISMVLERLGDECRELQIVESGGECKELLVMMRRDFVSAKTNARKTKCQVGDRNVPASWQQDDCLIRVYNIDAENAGDDRNDSPEFEFRRSDENNCDGLHFAESEDIVPGTLLFEPGKALMKAGSFRLIGQRFGASALGRDTHYYILRENTPDTKTDTSVSTGEEQQFNGNGNLKKAGKLFSILDIAEMSGKATKDFSRRHPEAEVTARNIRMTSEELRKRLGCKPSDRYHIFALHADKTGKNLLLFTERI